MSRKLVYSWLAGVLFLVIVGCGVGSRATMPPATATPLPKPVDTEPLPPPAPIEPLPTPEPTATETLPTPEPTLPPGPTVPLPRGPVIQRFSAGDEIAVTYIRMFDETNGWAIGGLAGVGDHVLKTKDGGNIWQDITPAELAPTGETRKSAAGFFQSLQVAWVTYYNLDMSIPQAPVVWWTLDGGNSWAPSQVLPVADAAEVYVLSDLTFSDAQNGWMLAHVGAGMNHDYIILLHTSDGGQTWERVLDPYTDGGVQICSKSGLVFTDPLNGWLTGDCNAVAPGVFFFHTSDGGATWQPIDLPEPQGKSGLFSSTDVGCGAYSPTFFSTQQGFIGVKCTYFMEYPIRYGYYLYSTSDGGISWSLAEYPGGELLFLDPETGWALGRDIFQTRDGGKNWTKLGSVSWDAQFSFINADLGWAVARSGDKIALVTTSNGGRRWAELQPKVAP